MKIGKTWGVTVPLLQTPLVEVHKILIHANKQCSLHMHRHKWNGFYCIDGAVDIVVEKNDYALTDVTELSAGEFTAVPPGEYHRFQTGACDARLLEIYWLGELAEDIERRDVGGNAHIENSARDFLTEVITASEDGVKSSQDSGITAGQLDDLLTRIRTGEFKRSIVTEDTGE